MKVFSALALPGFLWDMMLVTFCDYCRLSCVSYYAYGNRGAAAVPLPFFSFACERLASNGVAHVYTNAVLEQRSAD